jgi:topoisomerase IA-like protein
MAHVDISQKIEFIIEDQKITLEEAYADLLKPLARTVGGHANSGDKGAVDWFEQVFTLIINAAREILEEQHKKGNE